MIFRQLFEATSATYTYLLGCPETRQALLIDPVLETVERDIEVVESLGLTLAYTVETHVHADHLTGARKLKALTGCRITGSVLDELGCRDVDLEDGKPLMMGTVQLIPLHTPGHTASHLSFAADNGCHTMVFTGDSLLIDGCGRTDFQAGDATTLYRAIHEKLFSLPDDTLVYPGHDYQGRRVSTIGQEKERNPRLGNNMPLESFIQIMNNLNLPNPRKIEFAVLGNQMCGECPPNVPDELRGPCEIEVQG